MKYMIVKGYLGFGDRLESLKMAVSYALEHKLQIYVDWRDPIWSHGDEDFYTYFKLVNMPVLNSLDDIPKDATFYPPFWKDNLDKHITHEFLVENQTKHNLDLGVLKTSYDADVVVFSSIGYRTLYTDSYFFANVFRVIDRRIISKVNEHLSKYPVTKSWGAHIRGTDRLRTNRRTYSVQAIVSNIVTNGGLNQQHFVAVSDDKENIEIWKRFPNTYVVSQLGIQQTSTQGNHILGKDKLNVSKDEMNVDMLIDFFVLAHCPVVFSTIKDSRFAQEARRLHPVVNRILF